VTALLCALALQDASALRDAARAMREASGLLCDAGLSRAVELQRQALGALHRAARPARRTSFQAPPPGARPDGTPDGELREIWRLIDELRGRGGK
jgi:hypothetical protein